MTGELKTIRVGDINIAYRWDGPADGPVVMMAHAMGTSHRVWDLQVEALADRYRLLRYDWRGHGDTDAPQGPYTLSQFEADAAGLMDALDVRCAHWVGISTGGMIGQGLAINYPSRVMTLTLCNTTSQSDAWYRDWVAERQAVVRSGGMDPIWDMTEKLWFTDKYIEAKPAGYHEVRHVFVRTKIPGYLGGTSAVADLAYRDQLHQISCPTHVIAAGADPVTPVERSQDIHERISGSRLSIIPGQHHFSNVEVPEQFNPLLRGGLDQMIEHLEDR
ncbi:MAG: alpha/beta fold hydrolase [Pseudomonadota bacterium]